MTVEKPMKIDDPEVDILAEGWLHKVMVLFHKPAKWPGWVLGGLLVFFSLLAAGFWWLITGDRQLAQTVLLLQALLFGADMALLISLPKRGISYGPWQAQFVVLAIPRLLATAVSAMITAWFGSEWGAGLFISLQLLGMAALIWGTEIEPFKLRLTEFIMFSDKLPANSRPIRILHITDLHVERLTEREEAVVALAKKAKPDVILITGDYVNLSYNRDPKTYQQVKQLLRQLQAPFGVFATLGSPTVDIREMVAPLFDGLSIQLLRHDAVEVECGHGRRLTLLGLDCTHHIATDEARLHQLHSAASPDLTTIMLYHSPELMPQASAKEIDLYLCGHTHGGQVRLPLIGPLLTSSQLGRKYVMGLYRHGRTHLYVSRGIGLEGLSAPRVRFMCPPEMTLITIRPAG